MEREDGMEVNSSGKEDDEEGEGENDSPPTGKSKNIKTSCGPPSPHSRPRTSKRHSSRTSSCTSACASDIMQRR